MNCIYRIYNIVNGKSYIGATTQGFAIRWKNHMSAMNVPTSKDRALYKAFRKYGLESFSYEILEKNVPEHELPILEELYISQYNSCGKRGYNMTYKSRGVGARTEASRKAQSVAMIGRKITWNTRPKTDKLVNQHQRIWWKVKLPDGSVKLLHGLSEFCRENGLKVQRMSETLNGRRRQHRGYMVLAKFNDYPEREYAQAGGSGACPESLEQGKDIVYSLQ